MYILVFNNNVILGPVRWSRPRFETALMEELELDQLESSFPDKEPAGVVVYQTNVYPGMIKIFPVLQGDDPSYNDRIEVLNGPFWTFTDTHAISHYRPSTLPLESAKQLLKDKISSLRWGKQNAGVTVSIKGSNVKFPSDKEMCNVLQNYLSSDISTVNWKLEKDNWITLDRTDLISIHSSIVSHINRVFEEEKKIAEIIDVSVTHRELLQIKLE
jgi:hypothetical protein